MKTLAEIVNAVSDDPAKHVAVAAAADSSVIDTVKRASEGNAATAVLVGDEKAIRNPRSLYMPQRPR